MSNSEKENMFVELSDAMAASVAKAGASTVLVDARKRLPGSGISYSADIVLTADHILEREEDIQITLQDGNTIPASIAGRDPSTDLAVLKLSSKSMLPAEPAAKIAQVGQLVLALGRPSKEGVQASLGIISAIGSQVRTARGGLLEQYFHTDTTPFPGFSGGPLVDAAGRVLGVNTSGLAPGASLVIPARLAWATAEVLVKHGHIRRAYLGIRSQPVVIPSALQSELKSSQEFGLLLVGVENDSPASSAGLIVGDILVGLASEAITDPDQLVSRLSGELVGKPTSVDVLRGGKFTTIPVKIMERK